MFNETISRESLFQFIYLEQELRQRNSELFVLDAIDRDIAFIGERVFGNNLIESEYIGVVNGSDIIS